MTELTSNHLSTLRSDRWVEAGGTLVNLVVGTASLLLSYVVGRRANLRYFFWIVAAESLPGAGYCSIKLFGDEQHDCRGSRSERRFCNCDNGSESDSSAPDECSRGSHGSGESRAIQVRLIT